MSRWVPEAAVRAIHSELMAEHGGLAGSEREGARSAALARPQHLFTCGKPRPKLPQLAAAYAFALARGHCFPDGNKRLALAVLDVFLQLNGHELFASEPDAVFIMRGLAAGDVGEEELAEWVATNSRALR